MVSGAAKGGKDTNEPGVEAILHAIVLVRGQKLLLDADLARLYGTSTKRLNEQVRRNSGRFPPDFMFRLTADETNALNRSQIATGSQRHRDPRFPPAVFTEHGAMMAAMVLNNPLAIETSVLIVRAFVRLRSAIREHHEISRKLAQLEVRVGHHDTELVRIVRAIRALMREPETKRRGIGFLADLK
jgi:predicted RNA-binding protein YlqC (UPF0109 family)